MKFIQRQYGLRQYVTGGIHGAMGDSYNCMAILVSNIEKKSLWDFSQFISILSRTRIKNIYFFVGPKN